MKEVNSTKSSATAVYQHQKKGKNEGIVIHDMNLTDIVRGSRTMPMI